MRKHFHFIISLTFWGLMVFGFSDNWLTDVGQESNSEPGILIHAFFAFTWFSLLLAQASLVRRGRPGLHMTLGLSGLVVYPAFLVTTIYLYVTRYIETGSIAPLTLLNMACLAYGTLLIARGFAVRKRNPQEHRSDILFGTFMLMEPAISRSLGHLIGKGVEPFWLLTYLLFFGLFVWHARRVRWQVAIGFGIWLAGTINFALHMG
ncbi:hypothetical protein ABI59_17890 [Acidobacteria bacterium Mor1]|nr:hypothetical protein ABI59_17890 [Acidobacteria bacterium Mor1]